MRHLSRRRHTRDARPQHVPRALISSGFRRNENLEGTVARRAHLVDPQLQYHIGLNGVQRIRQRSVQIACELLVREVYGAALDVQHGLVRFQWRGLFQTNHCKYPAECVAVLTSCWASVWFSDQTFHLLTASPDLKSVLKFDSFLAGSLLIGLPFLFAKSHLQSPWQFPSHTHTDTHTHTHTYINQTVRIGPNKSFASLDKCKCGSSKSSSSRNERKTDTKTWPSKMKSSPTFLLNENMRQTVVAAPPAAPSPLPLHNCKLSTRWLTFGRRLWPRVKTLFSFQLSRRRQNNCHVQANTININMYRTCIHHGVYVCACIYCFLINQTKSERGGTQRRRSRFVVPARGKVGRGHLFILFTVIENGAALLANKIW